MAKTAKNLIGAREAKPRDREATRARLIEAAGSLLAREGFKGWFVQENWTVPGSNFKGYFREMLPMMLIKDSFID